MRTFRDSVRRIMHSPYAWIVLLTCAYYLPLFLPDGHFRMGDYHLFFVPVRVYICRVLGAGVSLPQWADEIAGGYPLLSDPQAATFFPLNVAFALLSPEPGARAMDLLTFGIVVLTAMGGVFLTRSFGIRATGCVAAASIMTFNGFVAMHLGQVVVVQTAGTGLWALGALARSIRTRSAAWAVGAGLLFACMLLAGHPQTALLLAYAALCGGLALGLAELRRCGDQLRGPTLRRYLAFALTVSMLAVAGAAAQILPTLNLLTEAEHHAGRITAETAMTNPLPLKQAVGLWFPLLYRPSDWRVEGPDQYLFRYAAGGEGIYYLGIVATSLALMGWLANARSGLVNLLVGVILLLMLGSLGREGGLYPLLYHYAPGFDAVRFPMRLHMVAFVGVGLLAGLGIDSLLRAPAIRVRRAAAAAIGFLIALTCAGALTLAGARLRTGSWTDAFAELFVSECPFQSWNGDPPEVLVRGILDQLTIAVVLTAGLIAGLLIVVRASHERAPSPGIPPARSRVFLGLLAVAGIVLELGLYGFHKNIRTGEKPKDVFAYDPWSPLPEKPSGRVLVRDAPGVVAVNSALIEGIEYAGGYTALVLDSARPFLRVPNPTYGPEPPGRLLDLFNVKYIIRPVEGEPARPTATEWVAETRSTAPGYCWLAPTGEVVDPGPDFAAVRARVLSDDMDLHQRVLIDSAFAAPDDVARANAPDATAFSGTARVVQRGGGSLLIHTDSNSRGWLVISQVFCKGWSALVDGQPAPIVRANGTLCAVPVEAGAHSVRLVFSTPGLRPGLLVSAVAWLAGFAFLGGRIAGRRRRDN